MLVLRRVLLVGEVDEKLRVALDGETLEPQSCCTLEAVDQALLFCDVVGYLLTPLEAELHGVIELVLGGRDEYSSIPCALAREGAVKAHDPTIWCFAPW